MTRPANWIELGAAVLGYLDSLGEDAKPSLDGALDLVSSEFGKLSKTEIAYVAKIFSEETH